MSEFTAPPVLAYHAPPPAPRKPRVWPAYLLPFALIGMRVPLAYAIGWLAFFYWSTGATFREHRNAYVALVTWMPFRLGMYALLMALNLSVLALFLAFHGRGIARRLALCRPQNSTLSTLIFALGCVALACLCDLASFALRAPSRTLAHIHSLIAQAGGLQVAVAYLIIGLIGPFLEELIFRGYVQTRLVTRHGPMLGIAITSLLFGIFHLDFTQGTFAFLIGLFLGTVAYRTGTIIPGFICHAAVNTISFLGIRFHVDLQPWLLVLIVSAIILVASLYLLWRLPGLVPKPVGEPPPTPALASVPATPEPSPDG